MAVATPTRLPAELPEDVGLAEERPFAPDYFVSPSGSDSNPGSEERPFRSVEKAVAMSRAGVEICFEPGVYTSGGRPSLDANGSASSPIIWRSRVPRGATFRGFQLRWSGDFARLDGIDFDGAGGEIESVYLTAARRAEVLNIRCRNSLGKAGIFASGLTECVVAGSEFWRIGNHISMDHGFYISNGSLWLVDCLAVGCAAWGFQFYPNDMDIVGAHLTAYDNRNGAFVLNNQGRGRLVNCVFDVGPNGDGLADSQYGGTSSTRWAIDHAIMYDRGKPAKWASGTPTITNVQDVGPQFVDPAASDFHLKSSSPAIGYVDPAYLPHAAALADLSQAGWLDLEWGHVGATPPPPPPDEEPPPEEPPPPPSEIDQLKAQLKTAQDALAACEAARQADAGQIASLRTESQRRGTHLDVIGAEIDRHRDRQG